MATAAAAIGGSLVSSLLGGIFGNRPQKTEFNSTESQNASQQQNYMGSQKPLYDEETIGLRNILMQMYLGRLFSSAPDVRGYTSQGISEINNASDLRTAGLNQILASRGLLSSPVSTNALINEQGFRVGQAAQLRAQAPLLQEQLFQSRLNDANNFFRGIPIGTSSEGQEVGSSSSTSNKSGTQTGSGNMLGGGFSSLGSSMAYLAGRGAFGKTPWQ